MTTTRRDILSGLGGLALGTMTHRAHATSSNSVARGSAQIIAEQAPIGRFGFILVDLESGDVVDSKDPDGLFIPASLAKIPTSIAAMKVLGLGARFATRIKADGKIENGTLRGDLHLIGGGDPSIDTNDLVDLSDQLRKAGVQNITGRFIYHDSALPKLRWLDKRQPWQAPYNPSIGGLNLNYNRVQFRWSRDGDYLRVRGAAVSDGLVMPAPSIQFRVTRSGPEIGHDISGEQETWTLRQSLLKGEGTRWLPVRKPGAYTAGVFAEVCAARGISLPPPESARQTPKGKEVAVHTSKSVHELLSGLLRFSNNLTAEALGVSAGYASGAKPVTIRHAAALTAQLTAKEVGGVGGKGWNGFALENHSGLSTLSRSTPRQLAYTLRTAHNKWGRFYSDLFVNRTLTAEKMNLPFGMTAPEHTIVGKTGSMHFVRGLAGFIMVKGRPMAFTFMANEDRSRKLLDEQYAPYSDPNPTAAANWSRRTKAFEREMLKEWVLRYSV